MDILMICLAIFLATKVCNEKTLSWVCGGFSNSNEIKEATYEKIPKKVILAFVAIMVFTSPTIIVLAIIFYNMIGIAFIAAVQTISTIVVYNFCKRKSEESIKTLNSFIFEKGYAPHKVQPVIRKISEIRARMMFLFSALLLITLALYGFSWIPSRAQDLSGILFNGAIGKIALATVIGTMLFVAVLKLRLMDNFFVKKYGVEFCFIDGYFKSRHENDLMNSIHWGIILNMIGSQLFMQFSKSVSHASFMANVSSSALSFIAVYVVMNIYLKNPSQFRFDMMKKSLVFYTCSLNSDNSKVRDHFLQQGSLQAVAKDPKVNSFYASCVRLYESMFLSEDDMLQNTVNGKLGLEVRNNAIYRAPEMIKGGVKSPKDNIVNALVDKCNNYLNKP